jgi:hypothetical protein
MTGKNYNLKPDYRGCYTFTLKPMKFNHEGQLAYDALGGSLDPKQLVERPDAPGVLFNTEYDGIVFSIYQRIEPVTSEDGRTYVGIALEQDGTYTLYEDIEELWKRSDRLNRGKMLGGDSTDPDAVFFRQVNSSIRKHNTLRAAGMCRWLDLPIVDRKAYENYVKIENPILVKTDFDDSKQEAKIAEALGGMADHAKVLESITLDGKMHTEKPNTEVSTEKPSTEKPSTEVSTEQVSTEKPSTEVSTEKPSTKVSTEKPSTEVSTEKPSTEVSTEVSTEKPSTDKPSTEVSTKTIVEKLFDLFLTDLDIHFKNKKLSTRVIAKHLNCSQKGVDKYLETEYKLMIAKHNAKLKNK